MFCLLLIREHVRIPPFRFKIPLSDAISNAINQRYANRIIFKSGLAITLYDILSLASDPYVHKGESSPIIEVEYRLLIFRPVIGEVIIGKIRGSDAEGITISLEFFDDIFIPAGCLQPNSIFDTREQVWIWNFEGNKLYMDREEQIRFKVLEERWNERPPLPPPTTSSMPFPASSSIANVANSASGPFNSHSNNPAINTASSSTLTKREDVGNSGQAAVTMEMMEDVKEESYKIIGTIAEDGLGLLSWWQ